MPAETQGMAAAAAEVSAQRLRAVFSSPPSKPAVLQWAMPGGGTEVVEVEGTAKVPDYSQR
jgi:hypothetical protein